MGSHSLLQGIFPTQGLCSQKVLSGAVCSEAKRGSWESSLLFRLERGPGIALQAMHKFLMGDRMAEINRAAVTLAREVAGKGLILPSGGNHVVFLELPRHSRVTTGISAFPLGWPWEAQSSPRVARESWGWRSSHCRA